MKASTLFCAAALALASMSASAQTNVAITNPEGEHVQYCRDGKRHFPYGMYMANEPYDWIAQDVVFGTDGAVYFQNIFTSELNGSYIKGTFQGNDKVVVELPQCIGVVDGYETYAYRVVFDWDVPTYKIDEKQTLTFTYKNGEFTLESSSPTIGFGYCDRYGVWGGVTESITHMVPSNYATIEPEKEMKTEQWQVVHSSGTYDIDVAFDGNEIWIKGISPNLPDAWITGTVANATNGMKKVVLPTAQYMGVKPEFGTHTFFMAAELYWVFDDSYDLANLDELEMDYDPVAGKIYGDEWTSCVINVGDNYLSISEFYLEFTMQRNGTESVRSAEMPAAVGTEYFDLQGRSVANPAAGAYIKVDRFADGTSKASKVLLQ